MKIALVSSVVPFIDGGYRNIVNWLAPELEKAGHQVETIWLPFDESEDNVLPQMLNYRLVRLEDTCDRVITFRPPAHLVSHPCKVVWFIHHLRVFFDLWGTDHSPYSDTLRWRSLRDTIRDADTRGLQEAGAVFSNSRIVSRRLQKYNDVDSTVLYPPIASPERFHNEGYGDELLFVCRIEPHKRQDLAVEAMKYTKTPVRLRLCGATNNAYFLSSLKKSVRDAGLQSRVTIDHRWISESEKIELMSRTLANVYLPVDEDSYGYPTLEAALSEKATISVDDAGGVSEFVVDGVSGSIARWDPQALAEVFDRYWTDRGYARRLGAGARARIAELDITWDRVVSALTAPVDSKS